MVQTCVLVAQTPDILTDISDNNKGKVILLNTSLGYALPAADLAKRFGNTPYLGMNLERLSADNWALGLQGNFFFSEKVREDPVAALRTPAGGIINSEQLVATVSLRERGWYLGGHVGRLFCPGNRRSGLRVTVGGGWQQHWIRVQDDSGKVTQLTGDYQKGYDRMTGGPTLHQFIGWQHLGVTRTINWFVGLAAYQGVTKNLRSWDFATMGPLTGNRIDLRFGVCAGWSLVFYQKPPAQIFY
jgi:hypothetical protein